MTEEIDTQALGAEGDRCSLCRAPLAIDQRSGGRRFGRDNRTVVGLEGGSPGSSAA